MLHHPLKERLLRAAIAGGFVLAVFPASIARADVPRPEPTDLIGSVQTSTTRSASDSPSSLVGIFQLAPGQCSSNGGVTEGSYFRMIQPRGDAEKGPFINNGNSPCGDNTYTPMEPGADGGLASGSYQPNPDPAFDRAGNSQASGIFEPLNFQGIAYGGSTNEVDPQTKAEVPAPSFATDGSGHLTGDVRAVSVGWNNQHFNQGAPKPDGSTPGLTKAPSGSFDSTTGAFVMEWTSTISGGPFDGFTGLWHLEGTFRSGAEPTAPRSSSKGSMTGRGSSASGSTSTGTTGSLAGTTTTGTTASGAGYRNSSLPFTGPVIPNWVAPMLLTLGLFSGLEWLRQRKSRRG
ncbi:MAG TPA: hypothetical protein VFK89_02100 [Actinomycetota bacterium]|nr:hypothetical protein [Actinomycetota bacterium]